MKEEDARKNVFFLFLRLKEAREMSYQSTKGPVTFAQEPPFLELVEQVWDIILNPTSQKGFDRICNYIYICINFLVVFQIQKVFFYLFISGK